MAGVTLPAPLLDPDALLDPLALLDPDPPLDPKPLPFGLATSPSGGYVAERGGHFLLADNAGIGGERVIDHAASTQFLLR
jgi:hypothetical protein